jgi:hypothetical protein
MPFTNLEPGQEMSLVYDINWSTTNQFPSSFRLEVVYEPDLNCPGNNAATLRPEAINQLFRSQTQVPGYEGIRPASKEPLRDEARPLEPAKVRPQLRTAATLDISGNWNSSIGATYKITQNGDRFNWGVRQFREQGSGRVTGARINANWEGERGTGRGNGRVIVDANANAVRIEWDNGVIFFR